MHKVKYQKSFLIVSMVLIVFFSTFHFYNVIVSFLIMPLNDAIAGGIDLPLTETSRLGERFRIAFKVALFMSFISGIFFLNKRTIISFMMGILLSYMIVKFLIFKEFIFFSIWSDRIIFSIEDYISYFIVFMIFLGLIVSSIVYKTKKEVSNEK